MLSTKIDIKHHRQYIEYLKQLNDDVSIIFKILYKIKFNKVSKSINFDIKNTEVYLEKNKNKFHIKHSIKSNNLLIIDKFSLWLALDLWLVNYNNENILDGLNFDKININIH